MIFCNVSRLHYESLTEATFISVSIQVCRCLEKQFKLVANKTRYVGRYIAKTEPLWGGYATLKMPTRKPASERH